MNHVTPQEPNPGQGGARIAVFFAGLITLATTNAVMIETLRRTVGQSKPRSMDALVTLGRLANATGFFAPLLAVIAVGLIWAGWRRSGTLARFVLAVALIGSVSSAFIFWTVLWGIGG